MKINVKETKESNPVLNIYWKVRDDFSCEITDEQGIVLKEYDGYVPEFMPPDFLNSEGQYKRNSHYGDYFCIQIDIETGKILNWRKDIESKFQEFMNNQETED